MYLCLGQGVPKYAWRLGATTVPYAEQHSLLVSTQISAYTQDYP
jgi:hypothetical protein